MDLHRTSDSHAQDRRKRDPFLPLANRQLGVGRLNLRATGLGRGWLGYPDASHPYAG